VLADRNVGEVGDRQLLRVVQGLLIRYLGLIEQAHVSLSQGGVVLAGAYLSYASELLSGSILGGLAEFRDVVATELTAQRHTWWRQPPSQLLWVVPLLVALALAWVSQSYLVARFRRTLNWPLLGATVGLLALGAGAGVPTWTSGRFTSTTEALQRIATARPTATALPQAPDAHLTAAAHAAANSYLLEYLMPLLAVAVVALVVAGFQQRLSEYRLRSR
jgi:hypothetical protein